MIAVYLHTAVVDVTLPNPIYAFEYLVSASGSQRHQRIYLAASNFCSDRNVFLRSQLLFYFPPDYDSCHDRSL